MTSETILYMCNFDEQINNIENPTVQKLWNENWSIDNKELMSRLLATKLDRDLLVAELKPLRDDNAAMEEVLYIGIAAFLKFCDINWNAHPDTLNINEYLGVEWPSDIDASEKLQCDSEPIYVNTEYPELLYFSSQILGALYAVEDNLVNTWWYFRSKVVHQRALEDTCATLYSELELLIAKLSNKMTTQLTDSPRTVILLSLEISQAFLLYGRIQGAEEYLVKSRELAGLKLELTGILGKRTKFQQKLVPQLALCSELDNNMTRPTAEESHGNAELPPVIDLQDDVRLNKIQYTEEVSQAELPSLEQTLCLVTVNYIQKSQPKDDLMVEELQPYVAAVLAAARGAWPTRVAALLARCRLEAQHKRTVERAMLQAEAIVNENKAPAKTRLSYLWAAGLGPAWRWRQQLAELYLALGLVKAALELCRELRLWEDVVLCYTLLQLRHKAAEVIQEQIDVNPTVKLYCLLGDATDDVTCYEKAWALSGGRSSRAQRHWGNFLFERKRYEDCIPHYDRSLEINSIQESVWLRLGYAALVTEQWALSARAYRRYTALQPQSFEAWNNLAKVYVNQRDAPRAHAALMEALRYNYDNWKLWENVILVSVEIQQWDDVVRGAHRLLELRRRYDDVPVLALLARATAAPPEHADPQASARLHKRVLELFGRITSIHQNNPELWQLYAELSPTYLLKAQRLLKAYRGYTQNGDWVNNPETCKKVIELAQSILNDSLTARKEVEEKDILQANSQLSSARLTGQAVVRAVEKQDWPETKEDLEELKQLFDTVTEYMKTIM